MDSEIIDTVADWSSKPYSGGYGGLHDLAEREFTGAVTDGAAWLFALNGRAIGVVGGTIESFADAEGTAYAAPDPSLPLLLAMREKGGETKAKYYTNDTSLSEADKKLSAGNFTGFVELSENVLSGDYYVVYHGGRRLACAFVGTQQTVLTGDEAFERADDEVGIYEVRTVDVEVIDVPEPEPSSADSAAAAADGEADSAASNVGVPVDEAENGARGEHAEGDVEDDDTDGSADGIAEPDDVSPAEPNDVATAESNDVATDPSTDDGAGDGGDDVDEPSSSSPPPSPSGRASNGDTASTRTVGGEARNGDGADAGTTADADDDRADRNGDSTTPTRREESREEKRRRDAEPTDAVAGSKSDPFSAEEQWRETRDIPSLDPDETVMRGRNASSADSRSTDASGDAAAAKRRNGNGVETETTESPTDAPSDPPADSTGTASGNDGAKSAETVESAELRQELQRAQNAREDVADELDATREELTEARSEADRLREENDRLEERVETLQADLADARSRLSEMGDAPADSSPISPSQALAGTNLFVRYDSKGSGTLEKAHAGGATREEVNQNLRLEVHTEFAANGAVVDGRPYTEWLADTVEYGFVEWAVRTLLYEIQYTNNESVMRDVFDAIPKIDRAELDGVVELVDDQGKKTEERGFDVVLRDRMGEPLIVANVTDSREATTESMLDGLVEGASSVAEQADELASAFHVTGSFFEPGALEAVADATGGGLLNRSKRKSFVKMSRKRGFHLCLVESRDGEFHVNVPEL